LILLGAVTTAACQQSASHEPRDTELASVALAAGVWAHADIGGVAAPGSWSQSGTTHTVKASGADIYGAADEMHFAYQAVTGDTVITAKVSSLTNTNAWSKAGVMIRETLGAGSKYVYSLVSPTPANLFRGQVRAATNGSTVSNKGDASTIPAWLRVARTGSSFTVSVSLDGTSWKAIGTPVTVSMASTALVGLAVTAHADGSVATAVFESVSITTPMCPTGQKKCGNGTCVATTSCCEGEACGSGGVCQSGACICPATTHLCNGVCLQAGQCCGDADCAAGNICAGGRCACPAGKRSCGGICADCCSDADCGNGMACRSGSCGCPGGTVLCLGQCGEKSCKECCDGSQCSGGRVCTGGSCACPAGLKMCAGGCAACCSNADCPAGDSCQGGRCQQIPCGLPGQPCCMTGGACSSGLVCNAGQCQSPPCGGAGQGCCAGGACNNGLVCSGGGQCVAPPPPCGGAGQACCTGGACSSGLVCAGGVCGTCAGHCGDPACLTSPDCRQWTGWINRDGPGGNGDGEHLSAMLSEGLHVCPNPTSVECRRAIDQLSWQMTGEVLTCTTAGLECLNASQSDGTCDDYEVRFLCPAGTIQ
jgi:regulation of enolase protein 1 (concanavalin A-like superfamily)